MNKKYYAQIPSYVTEINHPEERMMHFVKIANKVLMENTDFLKFTHEFMSIGLRKPAIREVMTSYYKDQVEKVRKTIESGIQSGTFIPIDSGAMARAIVLITIGAFNAYFTLDADFDLPKQHNFNITHMLKGLQNNHTP
jgi:hypothetical protein